MRSSDYQITRFHFISSNRQSSPIKLNYLELTGTIVGLIYLWLEYRASIYLWIAGFIMPAIYVFVYYDAGLYADVGINVYYLLTSFYGLAYWTLGKKASKDAPTEEIPISRTPRKQYAPLLLLSVILNIVIAVILIEFTDSNVPWADSFTTALSIVGMWMLAKKYVEQWLAWILVDVVSAVLYVYKDLYFTAGLYALYAVIAYFGYLKWKKMMTTPTV